MITVRVAKRYGIEWTFNYGTDQQLCSGAIPLLRCFRGNFQFASTFPPIFLVRSRSCTDSFVHVTQSAFVYVNYSLIQKTNPQ